MDQFYAFYVDDEHFGNHDCDDNTDDDHDINKYMFARACNARVNTRIYIYSAYMPQGSGFASR